MKQFIQRCLSRLEKKIDKDNPPKVALYEKESEASIPAQMKVTHKNTYIKISMLGNVLCVEPSKILRTTQLDNAQLSQAANTNTKEYNGVIIPLVDYRHNHGLTTLSRPFEIIFSVFGRPIALVVDGILETIQVEDSHINPPSKVLTERFDFVVGAIQERKSSIPIIDIEKLFGPVLNNASRFLRIR